MDIFVSKILFLIVFVSVTIFSVYALIRLFFILLPFLLAYALSGPLNKLVLRIQKRVHLSTTVLSFLVVVTFIGFFITLLGFGVYRGVIALSGFSEHIASITENIQSLTDSVRVIQINVPWRETPLVVNDMLTALYDFLFQILSSVTNTFLNGTLAVIGTLPAVALFIFFFFLSLYFFTKDRNRIIAGKEKLLSRIQSPFFQHLRTHSFTTVTHYIKAQFILVTITYFISLIGLTVLGVPFSPLIALGIAIVDFIPMVGPAAVYTPWIVFRLLFGDFTPALGLFIVYLITTLTRQTIEPKIVSSRIGAHPLITLLAMYICYRLIGVGGFILGPVLVMMGLIALNVYQSMQEKDEL